jgi:hypothetical protein
MLMTQDGEIKLMQKPEVINGEKRRNLILLLLLLFWSFPSLWKQVAVMHIFEKGNSALVTNNRPISILNNFSTIF